MKYAILIAGLFLSGQDMKAGVMKVYSGPIGGHGSFAVADVNGDGKRDIVVLVNVMNKDGTESTEAHLQCFLQGDGYSFKDGGKTLLDDPQLRTLVVSKGDAFEAVVGRINRGGLARYTWSKNAFTLAGKIPSSDAARALVAADVNGDKKDDFILFQPFELRSMRIETQVSVKLGVFSPREIDCGFNPVAVAVGDFNKDGKADFVAAGNGTSGKIQVFLGSGDGKFKKGALALVAGRPDAPMPNSVQPKCVAAVVLNKDGNPDLVVGSEHSCNLVTLLGDGKGNFSPGQNIALKSSPNVMSVGDWNGDGLADAWVQMVGMSATFQLYLGTARGELVAEGSFDVPGFIGSLAMTDLDGDKEPELVIGCTKMMSNAGEFGRDEVLVYRAVKK